MKDLSPVQMSLFSEDDADEVLSPYYPGLRGALLGAWADWEEIEPEKRVKLSPRARANIIYDFVLFRAREYFDPVQEVDLIERRGLFTFGVKGKVLLRFKKLNNNKKSSNIQTNQQIQLSLQRELPGMPPKAVNVIIGYQLDITQSKIAALLITFSNGQQLKWAYELPDLANDNLVQLPIASSGQSGNQMQQKPKVKPKNIGKKKDSGQA